MIVDIEAFKASVLAGEKPVVFDASAHFAGPCMGDLRAFGWSEKITTRNSMFWRYTGPKSIMVDGCEIKPGEYTEEIDMDWS